MDDENNAADIEDGDRVEEEEVEEEEEEEYDEEGAPPNWKQGGGPKK